jgi:hypothetical protein
MSADSDEDALAWAGDEPVSAPAKKPLAAATTAPDKAQTPAALLVTYGILAGAYLIYTIGWVVSVTRLASVRSVSNDALAEIMFQLGEFLAIASPALWFVAVFLLTRGRKPLVRLLWILAGLVAVLPWPFVLGAWA